MGAVARAGLPLAKADVGPSMRSGGLFPFLSFNVPVEQWGACCHRGGCWAGAATGLAQPMATEEVHRAEF